MSYRISIVSLFVLVCVAPLGAREIFQDLPLTHGLNLSATSSSAVPLELGPVLRLEDGPKPHWRLAQWGTRFNLEGAPETRTEAGGRVMGNKAKRIVIHPGGLAGEGVTLTVLGGVEFGNGLREKGEAWPHLLLGQRMPDRLQVTQFDALNFRLDFRVKRCDLAAEKAVERHLHTGQITAFFSIHNRNPESTDYRDMIWFGLPVFDARFDRPQGHQAVDGGKKNATGKFICTLPGERFYDRPTGDGSWHALRADLVPLVKEALDASQAKGFLTDTAAEDLHLSSFNLGWEVPGPYDCAITLKGLSLVGEEKDPKDVNDSKD